MNILYISSHYYSSGTGGALVSQNNFRLLNELDSVVSIAAVDMSGYLGAGILRKLIIFIRSLFGLSSALSFTKPHFLFKRPVFKNADLIWFDGSLYGPLVSKVKAEFKNKKVVVFFHNVEYDFYKDIYKRKSSIYSRLIKTAFKNEADCLAFSDCVITLTREDSCRLSTLYGRKADYVLPVFFDGFREVRGAPIICEEYVLFVGSNFPPNEEALRFLVQQVMPEIPDVLLIAVGKGLGDLEYIDTKWSNVKVLDYVEDLGGYYEDAKLVVCPIFSGGGMKVKVAEALSYGKVIAATKFALVGYDIEGLSNIIIAETAKDYIRLLKQEYPKMCEENLAIFKNEYSTLSQSARLNDFLILEFLNE
jgi:hypothetical protein